MSDTHQRIIERLESLHEWMDKPIDEQEIQRYLSQAGTPPEEHEILVKLLRMAQHSLETDSDQPGEPVYSNYPSSWNRLERRVLPDRRCGADRRAVPRSWDQRSTFDRRGNALYRYRVNSNLLSERG